MSGLGLPLSIFLAEVCVVTLSTVRIIFIARGRRLLAPLIGFFEVAIWLFAIGQIMKNLNELACYAAFAAGFTLGSFLGMFVEGRLALGTLFVRIVTPRDAAGLVESLRAAGYGVTTLDGHGTTGPVQVVFTIVPRREINTVAGIIREFDPDVFYSVDDIQAAARGVFPVARRGMVGLLPSFFSSASRVSGRGCGSRSPR